MRRTWNQWLPPFRWVYPGCGMTMLTRDAAPRCNRCGFKEGGVKYSGIDRCDECDKPLEDGQWLCGLCKRCERESLGNRVWERPARESVRGR